jgi:hypothetical protein
MNTDSKWTHVIFGLIAIAMIGGATFISGCSLGDIVKSRVPNGARGFEGGNALPQTPSHNESLEAYAQFRSSVEVIDEQWRENLAASGEVIGAITAFGNTAISQLGESPIAMTPIGGVAIGGLGMLWGLFIRKPGDGKKIDESYDDGLKAGREAVAQGVLAATAKVVPGV